uniref:Secreted protein n=1 Tax=Syphacia muris TaxID=451379 RepID=A0A0N5AS12_9BILA
MDYMSAWVYVWWCSVWEIVAIIGYVSAVVGDGLRQLRQLLLPATTATTTTTTTAVAGTVAADADADAGGGSLLSG